MAKAKAENQDDPAIETGSMLDIIPDNVMDLPDPECLPAGSEVMLKVIRANYQESRKGRMMVAMGLRVAEHSVGDFKEKEVTLVNHFINFLRPDDPPETKRLMGRNLRDDCRALEISPEELRDEIEELLTEGEADWAEGFASPLLVGREAWAILALDALDDGREVNSVKRWVLPAS